MFDSIDAVQTALAERHYVADRALATSLFLAVCLGKPLLLEGEAGVGKTEVAKALAGIIGSRLVRLQGYEGIDVAHAVYEWNYARQMVAIRMAEATAGGAAPDVFSQQFLIERPILQALRPADSGRPNVLLLDELDRVDDEFEAYLLEVLSDFQVTIPELGTITAATPPVVVITSNRTRELHDALKRRCLYHWIDYPSLEKEYEIVTARIPDAPERLRRQVVAAVQALRARDLYKVPGVAETLDWTHALLALGRDSFDEDSAAATLGVVLKNREDVQSVEGAGVRDLVKVAGS